ncbi:hypothetical protein SAMN05443144_101362 [Fodinibius roseus]|uniref:Uncharacterized protein n=1 Tax=Fodinibius roseus TaxID=1194090 RepID=A0A1M4TQX3_9BACT|nr:hypothetical protein SAMN05443144_101362 [Fodinibius roseus]
MCEEISSLWNSFKIYLTYLYRDMIFYLLTHYKGNR